MIVNNGEVSDNRPGTGNFSKLVKLFMVVVLGVAMNMATLPDFASAEQRGYSGGGHMRGASNRGHRARGNRGNRNNYGNSRRGHRSNRGRDHRRSDYGIGREGYQSSRIRDSRRLRRLRGYHQERSSSFISSENLRGGRDYRGDRYRGDRRSPRYGNRGNGDYRHRGNRRGNGRIYRERNNGYSNYRDNGFRNQRNLRHYDGNRYVDTRYPDVEYYGRRDVSSRIRDRSYRHRDVSRRLNGNRTLNQASRGMRELKVSDYGDNDYNDNGMRELVVDNRQAVIEAPYNGNRGGYEVGNPDYPYELPGPVYGNEYTSNNYAHCPVDYNCTVQGFRGRGAKLITLDKKGAPADDDQGGPKIIRLDESLSDELGTE